MKKESKITRGLKEALAHAKGAIAVQTTRVMPGAAIFHNGRLLLVRRSTKRELVKFPIKLENGWAIRKATVLIDMGKQKVRARG